MKRQKTQQEHIGGLQIPKLNLKSNIPTVGSENRTLHQLDFGKSWYSRLDSQETCNFEILPNARAACLNGLKLSTSGTVCLERYWAHCSIAHSLALSLCREASPITSERLLENPSPLSASINYELCFSCFCCHWAWTYTFIVAQFNLRMAQPVNVVEFLLAGVWARMQCELVKDCIHVWLTPDPLARVENELGGKKVQEYPDFKGTMVQADVSPTRARMIHDAEWRQRNTMFDAWNAVAFFRCWNLSVYTSCDCILSTFFSWSLRTFLPFTWDNCYFRFLSQIIIHFFVLWSRRSIE